MDHLKKLNLTLLVLLISWISSGQGQNVKITKRSSFLHKSIYTDLNAKAFCFRRTNGTHQFGCSSDPGGNVGVVHLVKDGQDVSWIVDKGIHDPYVALVTPKMFTLETLTSLKESGKINGMILLGANDTIDYLNAPEEYSDDAKCPNSPSSIYKGTDQACPKQSKPWNPTGSGILMEDWSFPIFLVDNQTMVDKLIHECYEAFNKPHDDGGQPRDWPLCSIELLSHMIAAVDTKTCQRRNDLINIFAPTHVCDPMGDQNIFHLNSQTDFTKDKFADGSVLVLSARLDTVNLFDKVEVGLDSPTSSIITLLSAAELMYRTKTLENEDKKVLFALLNGESFDYIGSSRMAYDMKENQFPAKRQDDQNVSDEQVLKSQWPNLNFKSILAHIELGQVISHENANLFAHVHNTFDGQGTLDDLVNEGQKVDLSIVKTAKQVLPPSSIQSLLKEDSSVPGILLSNFDEAYTNKFYHSLYDNSSVQDNQISHLSKVSETIARFAYKQLNLDVPEDFIADVDLISGLIKCYTVTAKCDLFRAMTSTDFVKAYNLPDYPLPQYVGVERSKTYHTLFTHRLLVYLTSKPLEGQYSTSNCTAPNNQTVYDLIYMNGVSPPSWWKGTKEECEMSSECGFCYNTTAWLAPAVSPGKVLGDPTSFGLEFSIKTSKRRKK